MEQSQLGLPTSGSQKHDLGTAPIQYPSMTGLLLRALSIVYVYYKQSSTVAEWRQHPKYDYVCASLSGF